jgi:hypothetical protein
MTRKDGSPERSRLTDDVLRVRQWGTVQARVLPTSMAKVLSVGSAKTSWLYLYDSEDRVSAHHGDFFRQDGKWMMRDAGSTNGIVVDGRNCAQFILEPGQVIHIGGVTLVAESYLSMAVHAYLSRVIGWSNLLAVDLAMRALRIATMRETALVLRGADNLVSIARELHCRAVGVERPFVVCAPTQSNRGDPGGIVSENGILTTRGGMSGLRTARDGSLCVFHDRLPRDYVSVMRRFHDPDTRVMLIMCAKSGVPINGVIPIEIPPLASRTSELRRIVEEYIQDAKVTFGAEHSELPANYVDWIINNETKSLVHIERATQRLVALREGESVYSASKLIGVSRQSMATWIEKHGLQQLLSERHLSD